MVITLPDGREVEFPDNMSETQVRTQLLKLAPKQQTNDGLARTAALKAGDMSAAKASTWKGSILPISGDGKGSWQFDSDAGLLGALKSAVTLPGDVYAGRVDPNSDEALGRSIELAGIAAPMNPAVAAGERAIPGMAGATRKVDPRAPTVEELKSAANAGYDRARNMGVTYTAAGVRDMAAQAQRALEADGIIAETAPNTHALLGKLQSAPDSSVADVAGLEAARKAFGHLGQNFNNPTEQLASSRVREALDRFLEGGVPDGAVAGPASVAGAITKDARGNYAAAKRSEQLNNIEYAADVRSAAANSGANYDNSLRSRIASVLTTPKKRAGFSPEEIAALESVDRGTLASNTLRRAGNYMGGGGGLGGAFSGSVGASGAFTATGDPFLSTAVGLGIPATGAAMKMGADALSQRAFNAVDEMTRKRSPLYQNMMERAPVTTDNVWAQDFIRRLLATSQGAQGQP